MIRRPRPACPGVRRGRTAGASAVCAAGGSRVLRRDADPVGWVQDRFMLLVPANAVVLVCVVAEQFDDLATSRRLTVQPARLDAVANMCRCFLWCHGESFNRPPAMPASGPAEAMCGDLLSRLVPRPGIALTGRAVAARGSRCARASLRPRARDLGRGPGPTRARSDRGRFRGRLPRRRRRVRRRGAAA